ncbi:unnamed protein product [Pleuronectes platessa]|uniref:Uncharacterized protein n=1 Tax=Pleuronectes platessa TaxID=8262 RepID=A0A9N7V6N5_PLEPL|nr:unnamed protein product [Pleuronectes platessa]
MFVQVNGGKGTENEAQTEVTLDAEEEEKEEEEEEEEEEGAGLKSGANVKEHTHDQVSSFSLEPYMRSLCTLTGVHLWQIQQHRRFPRATVASIKKFGTTGILPRAGRLRAGGLLRELTENPKVNVAELERWCVELLRGKLRPAACDLGYVALKDKWKHLKQRSSTGGPRPSRGSAEVL